MTSGVPQGSVLGPTLFIYFINDMPENLRCFVKIFADDITVCTAVQSDKHCRLLQNSIDQLVQWSNSKDWQLKFSYDTRKMFHVGENNPEFKYFMDGTLAGSFSVYI